METDATRRNLRVYFLELGGAVLVFMVVVFLVRALVDFDTAGDWKFGAALLPLIPLAAAAIAIHRHIRRSDEMVREIILRGMALGFAFALAASATIGFLQEAGLDTGRWGAWGIFCFATFGWVLGSLLRERRLG